MSEWGEPPLIHGWGECYVNQALLSTLLKNIWGSESARHCFGVTRCIEKIEKIEAKGHGDDKAVFLVDYEYDEDVRRVIQERLSRRLCQTICEGEVVRVDECRNGRVIVLLFKASPEDIISSKVPGEYARKLNYKKFRRSFKSAARKYASGLKCKDSDWVEELLCRLYRMVKDDLNRCALPPLR